MKKVFLSLLFFLIGSVCFAQQPQELYFIPLADTINSTTPRHLLKDNECPSAVNCRLDNGKVTGRAGYSEIFDFATDTTITNCTIKGVWKANENYMLIAAGKESTWGQGNIYEWNLDTANPIVRALTPTSCTTCTWRFTNHYDNTIGNVTILTNGVDNIQKYDHEKRTCTHLIASGARASQTKGYYVASFYDALYLASITMDDGVLTTDPYAVVWSEIGDASDFSVAQYYQRRPEDGLPITALKTYNDYLLLGKGNNSGRNQLWQITPYSNFARLSDKSGPSNNEGSANGDTFFYNDKGRILTIEGEWISQPVHERVAGSSAGTWDIYSEYNVYDRKLLLSSGRNIFTYNALYKTWEESLYGDTVQIYAALTPGIPWKSWIGPFKKHNLYSFRQEDTIADSVFVLDGSKLCITNHFSDDNEGAIKARYETRTDPCGDVSKFKRFQQVVLYGKYFSNYYYTTDSVNTYTVYGSFQQSPARVSWERLGTVTLNSQGYGELWFDKRGIWTAIAVEVSSRNPWELERIGLRYTVQTQR